MLMHRVTTLQVLWSSQIFIWLFVAFLALLPKLRILGSYLTVYIKLFINSKWGPALARKEKAGMVHSVSGWTRGVQVNCEIPWERVPYLSALKMCSRRGAIQIHVYLYLDLYNKHACHVCMMLLNTGIAQNAKLAVNKIISLTAWHLWLLVSFLTLHWQLSDSLLFPRFPVEFVEQKLGWNIPRE